MTGVTRRCDRASTAIVQSAHLYASSVAGLRLMRTMEQMEPPNIANLQRMCYHPFRNVFQGSLAVEGELVEEGLASFGDEGDDLLMALIPTPSSVLQ